MLQMVRFNFSVAFLLLLLCGCDRVDFKGFIMPTGDVVNSRFEQSFDLHYGTPVACIDADGAYVFYVCTDPHVSNEAKNIKKFAKKLRSDDNASFGVVLGDCIDKRGAMPLYLDAITYDAQEQGYDIPIFSVIGNHDLYFSAWDDFRKLVGPSVYWFEVSHTSGKDVFITLDSASGTHGSKQLKWLKEFLAEHRKEYRHCVVLTHTNILYTDNSQGSSGNLPIDETMMLMNLFGKHNVTLCLQGHDHHRDDLMFNGVRYTIVGTIRDEAEYPEYLCVSFSDEGVKYDWKLLE
jgi:predicted phosphodiesterase